MNRMFWAFLAVSAAGWAGLLALTAYSVARVPSWGIPPDVVQGKLVWQRGGCVECHTVLGNGGYVGVDLTFVAAARSERRLRDFFRRPPVMRPGRRIRHPALSGEDVDFMVAYLRYLSGISTPGWPPPSLGPRGKD